MIPRGVLTDLEVVLPGLETQRRVVAVDALARRERALSIRAAEERRRFNGRILEDLVGRANPAGGEAHERNRLHP